MTNASANTHVELRRGSSAVVVVLRDDALSTRFGRFGKPLQERSEQLSDGKTPSVQFRRRVTKLLSKGYVLASHAENETLLAQIAEDPERAELYEVYADWLEEAGDPRAIVIRAGITATQSGRVADALTFERLLHEQHFSFVHHIWSDKGKLRPHITWRFGFIAEVTMHFGYPIANGAEFAPLSNEDPTRGSAWRTHADVRHLQSILKRPPGRFLRKLEAQLRPGRGVLPNVPRKSVYDVRLRDGVPELRKHPSRHRRFFRR